MNPLRENVFSSFPEIVCSQFGRGKYLISEFEGLHLGARIPAVRIPREGALIHSLSVETEAFPHQTERQL